jgi:predicted nucleic acid-binding protein
MMNTDFFQVFYTHLEERSFNNVYEQLKQEEEYQEALRAENVLLEQYEGLDLSEVQRKVIEQWTDAIHAKNAAYSMVIFRMGMQCCFSLIMELADLR